MDVAIQRRPPCCSDGLLSVPWSRAAASCCGRWRKSRGAGGGRIAQPPRGAEDATYLCNAASTGDLHRLRKLVARGADINAADYDGRAALHLAAADGKLVVVNCLVNELNADFNAADRWGGTPLDDAIRSGHPSISAFLISSGAATGKTKRLGGHETLHQLPEESKGESAGSTDVQDLCKAACRGDLGRLRELAGSGVDVNAVDHDRRSAIHVASSEGQLYAVQCLVDELGADRSCEDRWGSTPLDEAIRSEHEPVSEYLLSRGAARGRPTPFVYEAGVLCDAGARGDLACLRGCMRRKVDINLSDYDRRTALHLAAFWGDAAVCGLLLKHSAFKAEDARIKDKQGYTALDYATDCGHTAVAKAISAAAPEPNDPASDAEEAS
mmetsp:Transcript_53075/g.149537  ORF Transcript_53075/g.149537 Transcript_53075/m.149537 type:complete len:383 (-) Transcript_53075:112-1260(-)